MNTDMQLTRALRLALNPASPDVISFVAAKGKSRVSFRLAQEIVNAGQRVVTVAQIAAEQIAQSPAHLLVKGQKIDWGALEQRLEAHNHCLLVSDEQPPEAADLLAHLVDILVHRGPLMNLGAIVVVADDIIHNSIKACAPHESVIPDATTLLVPVFGLGAIGQSLIKQTTHRPELLRSLLNVTDTSTRLTPAMAAHLLHDPQRWAKGHSSTTRFLPLLDEATTQTRRLTGRLITHLLAERGQSSLLGAVGVPNPVPVLERWGPTTAIVLAAGAASRMGIPKQLLTLDGEALVVRAARLALESGAGTVRVVIGAYAEQVEKALLAWQTTALQETARRRLRLIYNPDWETGQASSIRAAVRTLPASCEAALFFPVDQPNLPASLLRCLWQSWQEGSDRVATVVNGSVRGAPAIFDRNYIEELLALRGDQGARSLLKRDAATVAAVSTTASAVADVDTPEEWERLLHINPL